ncbi:hypothetical protein HDU93_008166 [Gonapodya sp. JEL0774]|nr:hypothetical protein HDU93_008166 [Gonapodya sp. JEL0774]
MAQVPRSLNPFEDATAAEHPWTVRDIGVNAISGIMNDPASQSKGSQKATKLEVPPIPPTAIRKVRLAEFDPYLKAITDVYDKYQFNRAMGLEGTPLLAADLSGESASYKNLLDITKALSLDSSSQEEISANLAVLDTAHKSRVKPYIKTVPSVDSVPSIFFSAEFSLEDPETFRVVTGVSGETTYPHADDRNQSDDGVGGLFSSAALQESLSHHLDTVEVHLIREISRRSSSFFSTLANLQTLHSETVECVREITELQQNLGDISKVSSRQGLEVVRLKRRRENLGSLLAGLKLISNVKEAQQIIQMLIDQGDYGGALNVIEETTRVLEGTQPHGNLLEESSPNSEEGDESSTISNLCLSDIVALKVQRTKLVESVRGIFSAMESAVVNILLTDIRDFVKSEMGRLVSPGSKDKDAPTIPKFSSLLEHSPASADANAKYHDQLEQRLYPAATGLMRMGKFGSAIQAYKEAVMKELKVSTKKLYPTAFEKAGKDRSNGNQGSMKEKERKQAALATQLRSMTLDAFADLLMRIYSTVLLTLHRVALGQRVLLSLIAEAQARGTTVQESIAGFGSYEGLGDLEGSSYHPRGRSADDEDDDLDDPVVRATGSVSGIGAEKASASNRHTLSGGNMSNASQGRAMSSYSQEAYQAFVSETKELCGLVTDYAHMRVAKLLGIRSDQNTKLNGKDFFRLFGATWEFVAVGEQLCGRMCFGLKGTIMSQAKSFLHNFHDEKMKQTATLIENEPWAQSPVPVDFQHITDKLVDAGSESVARVGADIRASMDIADVQDIGDEDEEDGRSPEEGGVSKGSEGTATSKFLLVRKQRFYIVGCVLIFIRNLSGYEESVQHIPSLGTDALQSILEIITLFNSRMCQVILGAGAVASVGLKTITAKHLGSYIADIRFAVDNWIDSVTVSALASQSLAVVIALIPYLKLFFQNHLSNKQYPLLGDFDKKIKDLQDHQIQIHQKLVSIMNERLVVHRRILQNTNWDDWSSTPGSEDSSKPSNYMQALVKDLMTLHKVLSKYLQAETLKVRACILHVFPAHQMLI